MTKRRLPSAPWWQHGLRFGCNGCGDCCRGPQPGFVEVDEEMIARLAEHLELTPAVFTRRFVRRLASGTLSLTEKKSGDCIFWEDDRGCGVYEVRPLQCRTFPFWPEVVESQATWDQHAAECPGMFSSSGAAGDAAITGRLYARDEVEAILAGHAETSPGPASGSDA